MELVGDLINRHPILQRQLDNFLDLLFLCFALLAGRLRGQNLLLFRLKPFYAILRRSDFGVVVSYGSLLFSSSSAMAAFTFSILQSTSVALSCGVRRGRLFSDSAM